MNETSLPFTIVNHVAMNIAVAPDIVWAAILDEYVEARKFRDLGFTVEPLDDPSAPLGGYRTTFEQDGVVTNGCICRVTELDPVRCRLSMTGEYLAIPGGMTVYATYHADRGFIGTRYAIDCHSAITSKALDADKPLDVALAETTVQFGDALQTYLEGLKTRLETAHPPRASPAQPHFSTF